MADTCVFAGQWAGSMAAFDYCRMSMEDAKELMSIGTYLRVNPCGGFEKVVERIGLNMHE